MKPEAHGSGGGILNMMIGIWVITNDSQVLNEGHIKSNQFLYLSKNGWML